MTPPRVLDSRDAILSAFDQFREDLDDHNDRRERLIKVCLVAAQPDLLLLVPPDCRASLRHDSCLTTL